MPTGVRAAFRRNPATGSLFGHVTPRGAAVVFAAELLGTGMLLLFGCMGGVKGIGAEDPTHLLSSLAFGLVVAAIIQTIGHISVAHINPAITLCALLRGDVNAALAAVYCVAQTIGAILGFGLLVAVTPTSVTCDCSTVPSALLSPLQATLIEGAATATLVMLAHAVWDRRNSHNSDSVPLKFGFLVAAIAMVAGPYTGASMNPARTLAPAVWKGIWTSHWVYWVGPLAGSAFGTLIYLTVFEQKNPPIERVENDPESGCKAESVPLN